MNLRGMNFKPAGQLSNGLFPLEGGQGYLGLERRAVLLPALLYFPAPLFPLFQERGSLLSTCPIYWVHLTLLVRGNCKKGFVDELMLNLQKP